MLKIGVIGDRETVIGFKALGLNTFPADNVEEAREALKKAADPEEEYAIIYITENLAQYMGEDIKKHQESPTLAVILIPGREGSLGLGQSALKDAVERAVGSDIL